jgi:hypothetical protein
MCFQHPLLPIVVEHATPLAVSMFVESSVGRDCDVGRLCDSCIQIWCTCRIVMELHEEMYAAGCEEGEV